jgi:hypothetical protein
MTMPLFFASQTYRRNFLEAYNTAQVMLVILLRREEETEQCSFFSWQNAYMLQVLALDQHRHPFKSYK